MKLTKDDIKRVKERADKATCGPWAWDSPFEKVNGYVIGVACDLEGNDIKGRVEDPDDMVDEVLEYQTYIGEHEALTCNYADPEFISHARTDVPSLCETALALYSKLDETNALVESAIESAKQATIREREKWAELLQLCYDYATGKTSGNPIIKYVQEKLNEI